MAIAIPGSKGCFSFLQHVLHSGAQRIKITKEVRDQLLDFLSSLCPLATSMLSDDIGAFAIAVVPGVCVCLSIEIYVS